MKILAIDFGNKRIGLAISCDNIVGGLDTLIFENLQDGLNKLLEIIRHENVEKIIIGMPTGNTHSEDQILTFAHELNKVIQTPIEFTDENYTSKEAERLLKNSNLDPRSEKYKQEVDRISAKLILEQYLNNSA